MKQTLLLGTAAVLVAAAAVAQLHITSLTRNGELAWTNPPVARGFYNIESADAPVGPWRSSSTVADLDWSSSNRLIAQVPLTNAQAYYRVAWERPDPVGVWDYRGYDSAGTLVVTGQLAIGSMTLQSSNPPVVYNVRGSWNLGYAGPSTNQLWWLGPQIPQNMLPTPGGTNLGGTVELHNATLRLVWPTNIYDINIQLLNTLLGPNTYTGIWVYATWVGPQGGPFGATRVTPPTDFNPTLLSEPKSERGETP
ncbi:MAG: hypothetical protein HOP33_02110 [Verrucomicrobia bacterium]|nr:hypothetical protein [Verrucomicrobiota bacterium]